MSEECNCCQGVVDPKGPAQCARCGRVLRPDPEVCAVCGSEDVQHAMWVSVNTNTVLEEFGSWCAGDNAWCPDCERNDIDIIKRSEFERRQREKHDEACDMDEDCSCGGGGI